ncbi:hypothetical protein K0X99_002707, partial [Enterococcus faecium]|nr:hypothetical protein [Enterococcus faecium]
MKKIFVGFIGLCIFVVGITSIRANALENSDNVNGITLLTEEVPENLIRLVKGRLPYFDSILLNSEGITSGDKDIG